VAGLVQHLGTGRRKTAVARIFLRSGKGQITVNGRSFENYFVNEAARAMVRQPLLAAEWRTSSTSLFWRMAAAPTVRPARRGWASPARCSNSIPSCAEAEAAWDC
jgi:hypothetical protein